MRHERPAVLSLLFMLLAAGACDAQDTGIFLPGTQPGEGNISFGRVDQCLMCHSNTSNGDADPFFSWRAG